MAGMKWRREVHLPMALEERVREIARIEEVLVADLLLDLIERGIEHFDAESAEIAAERGAMKPAPLDVMTQADEAAADAWARLELQAGLRERVEPGTVQMGLQAFVKDFLSAGDDEDLEGDDAPGENDDDEIIRVGAEPDEELAAMIPSKPLVRLKVGHPENEDRYVDAIDGLYFSDRYLVLAEVEDIEHYVVMNLRTGQVLRGMFHLGRFERVPAGEI